MRRTTRNRQTACALIAEVQSAFAEVGYEVHGSSSESEYQTTEPGTVDIGDKASEKANFFIYDCFGLLDRSVAARRC